MSESSTDDHLVTYLMVRMQKNWGATLSQAWEKAGAGKEGRIARERQALAYRRLRAEYAVVIAGRDRPFIDEVIEWAQLQHADFAPRPPQLLAIVRGIAEQHRRREAEREQARRVRLPAPKVSPETVYKGRAYLKAFVKLRGNLE